MRLEMGASQREPGGPREAGSDYEVVVVGAGQAGLAIGYFLEQQGRRFVILEAADSIGSAWRDRWDSLTLFTPRRYSGLPGLPFPGDPEGYPDRDEVIAYLERYAETFELPIELNSPVRRLTAEDGRFVLEVDGRTITADQVVVATGPFQKPFVPEVANRLGPDLVQMHATGYRKPGDIPRGNCPRRWRRQHRFPDREGALENAPGCSRGRLEADAAAAAAARTRSLLVADEVASFQHNDRFTARAPAEHSGHADRLQPARAPAPLRGRAETPRRRRGRPYGAVRGRERARSRRRSSGRPDTGPTTPGSTFPSSTRPADSATGEA